MKSKRKSHEINNSKFYNIGKWIFFTVAVSNLAAWIDLFGKGTGVEIVKMGAFTIFYFISTGFFSFLAKQADAIASTDSDLEEMNKALENLEVKK